MSGREKMQFCRRGFVLFSSACCLAGSVHGIAAQTSSKPTVQWTISRDDLALISTSLKYEGTLAPDLSSGTDTRGLPIIYILVGIITISNLADALLTLYQRGRGGGIVVQDSEKGLIIKRDDALPSDVMLIKNKNGIQVREISKIQNSTAIVDALKVVGAK
jgi:hypothetical protein